MRQALIRCEALLSQLQDNPERAVEIIAQGYFGVALAETRAALASSKEADMLNIVRFVAQDRATPDALCHVGLCSMEECSRCSRILKAQEIVRAVNASVGG